MPDNRGTLSHPCCAAACFQPGLSQACCPTLWRGLSCPSSVVQQDVLLKGSLSSIVQAAEAPRPTPGSSSASCTCLGLCVWPCPPGSPAPASPVSSRFPGACVPGGCISLVWANAYGVSGRVRLVPPHSVQPVLSLDASTVDTSQRPSQEGMCRSGHSEAGNQAPESLPGGVQQEPVPGELPGKLTLPPTTTAPSPDCHGH